MDVVVDQVVAVLQVLAFGDAVGGDQKVNVRGRQVGVEVVSLLRSRREATEQDIQIRRDAFVARHLFRPSDERAVPPMALLHVRPTVFVEVVRGVSKGREYDHFDVFRIERGRGLVVNQLDQSLEFLVLVSTDVDDFSPKGIKNFEIFSQIFLPSCNVHVGQRHLHFFADHTFFVAPIRIPIERLVVHPGFDAFPFVELALFNFGQGAFDELDDALEGDAEGIDGALKALEQVDAHQDTQAIFTTRLR